MTESCMRPDCTHVAKYKTRISFPTLASGSDTLVVNLILCSNHTLFKTVSADVDINGHMLTVEKLT